MKEYKHVFDALMNGEEIEVQDCDGSWSVEPVNTVFAFLRNGVESKCFRVKPKTIRIGEYDVPEPVREPLEMRQEYYIVFIVEMISPIPEHNWRGSEWEFNLLSNGLIHLTPEAAAIHSKALISLSKKG